MIWFFFFLWALVIMAGMWRFAALPKAALPFLGVALLLAAAGYAVQGRPSLMASPARSADERERPETAFAALREEFFPQFDTASRWLIIADSYQRRGGTRSAAGVIQSALRQNPENLALWVGLGNALVIHGNGMMSPAAELAYRRAMAIAPDHPAPRFFYGLSLIQAGQIEAGEGVWRDLLAAAPANAEWRPAVASRLVIIGQIKAMRPN